MTDLSGAASVVIVGGYVKAVSPGFIDMHAHSDLSLLVQPTGDSKIQQGVTIGRRRAQSRIALSPR